MWRRDLLGWANIRTEQLSQLDNEGFEDFCHDLIVFEAYDRHAAPRVDPPAGPSAPDGGRDILLTLKNGPLTTKLDYQRQHKLEPLTEDTGRTAYSCKTGKNWLSLALRDVEKRRKPGRAIEVLLEGGYFKLLISVPGKLDAPRATRGRSPGAGESAAKDRLTPREQLCAALWKRMQQEEPHAPDPSERVEILDAGAIAGYLRARRPESGAIANWANRFDVTPLLEGVEAWRAQHAQDRADPAVVSDERRARVLEEMRAFFEGSIAEPADRSAWLLGAPGVGKTRLVLETIASAPVVAQRMRVAWSPQAAEDALYRRLLDSYPNVVLVVDDCPAADVNNLVSLFMRRAASDADVRLLVITPAASASEVTRVSRRWSLEALAEEARLRLVANELGAEDRADTVREVAELSEGYPWFAKLLADEAREQGRPPRGLGEAVRWALASSWETSTPVDAEALRLRRARCLLGASLTTRVDWDRLSEAERDQVTRAVGLARWQDLVDTALECVNRGILRRNVGWQYKYVTPRILEREVIRMLLGPNGPDPGGRTLLHHGSAYSADFFATLEQLNLPEETLACVNEAVLEDLQRARTWQGLQELGLRDSRLLFAARHAPVAVARALNTLVQRTDLSELLARQRQRRGVVFALETVMAHTEAFCDAESALFRLAQAENESYANNATQLWEELFLPSSQALPLGERLRLLVTRVRDADPAARQVAIGGLHALVTAQLGVRVADAVSRGFREPTEVEVAEIRAEAWQLLASCAADPDAGVAGRARSVLTSELPGAIRGGLGDTALDAIQGALPSFDEDARIALRDTLAEVRAYDGKWLGPCEAQLGRLEELLNPATYSERLRQQLGGRRPAGERDFEREAAQDDALVSEGLCGDAPLLDELDWLVSDRAKLGHVFAYALGRRDAECVLWERLRLLARQHTGWLPVAVCGRYIAGHAEAGRVQLATELLDSLEHASREADVFAVAVVELGANDQRLAQITQDLRSGSLTPYGIGELTRRRGWLGDVSGPTFSELVAALLHEQDPERPASALQLVVQIAPERLVTAPLLLLVLERAARGPLSGVTGYLFEQGVLRLAALGAAAQAATCAVTAARSARGGGDHVWKALGALSQSHTVHTWRAIARALEEEDFDAGHLAIGFRFQRHPFEWPSAEVLAWVGPDERRGRVVAAMVQPGSSGLHPVHRGLIERFGAHSSCAREIVMRVRSTDGAVPSLAEHDAERLAAAESLLNDPVREIRDFAEHLVGVLRRSLEDHTALEEDERRRFGT